MHEMKYYKILRFKIIFIAQEYTELNRVRDHIFIIMCIFI